MSDKPYLPVGFVKRVGNEWVSSKEKTEYVHCGGDGCPIKTEEILYALSGTISRDSADHFVRTVYIPRLETILKTNGRYHEFFELLFADESPRAHAAAAE